MATLGDAFVRIHPDTTGFGPALSRGIDGPAKSMSGKFGQFAKRAGLALGAAGAYGAAAFVKSSISLEQEFGKTMNQLQAATNTPAKGMHQLSNLALKMGTDTVFSASDASEAMLELARQGISTAAIKAGALESALTLAAAGGIDMERSATVMGNALNTFNIKASKSDSVAAALAGAANASSASVDSIAQGMQQVGTVAADAGFSIQETTGAIAALANAGIAGSDAGTSLKTMFSRLVPSTKAAFEAMGSYGLVNYDANTAAKVLATDGIQVQGKSLAAVEKAIGGYLVKQGVATKGTAALADATDKYMQVSGIMHNAFLKQNGDFKNLGQIAGLLHGRLKGLSDSERATALNTIFGSDARRAATVLMNEGSKGLARYVKASSNQHAAEKMAQASMKGTAGAMEQMKGSVETASLVFGQAIRPVTIFAAGIVTKIANGAVPIIQSLGKHLRGLKDVDLSGITGWFHRLLPPLHEANDIAPSVMRGLSGTGGAQGGDRSVFASVSGWLDRILPQLHKMGPDAKKAFTGIGPALMDAKQDLPSFSDLLKVTGVVLKFAADHVGMLAKAMPYLVAAFAAVKVVQLGANAAAAASPAIRLLEVGATRAQTKALRELTVAQRGGTVSQEINTGATAAGTKLTIRSRLATIGKTIAEKAGAVASKAMAAGQWLLNAALTANPIGLVVGALALLVGGLILAYKKSDTFRKIVDGAFKTVWGAIKFVWDWVKENWPLLLGILAGPIGLAVAYVVTHWDKVKKATIAVWNKVKGAVLTAISFVWNWIKENWPLLLGIITGPIGLAVAFVITHWDKVKSATMRVWTAIKDGVSGAWEKMKDLVKTGALWIVDKMLWFADKLLGVAGKAFGWIPGIGDKLESAQDKVQQFRKKVNAEMDAIHGPSIKVKLDTTVLKGRGGTPIRLPERAAGGPISGGRPGVRDSVLMHSKRIGAWWGDDGEHVFTRSDVRKAGGHQAMFALRRMIQAGAAGVDVMATQTARRPAAVIGAPAAAVGQAREQQVGPGGSGGGGVHFHGQINVVAHDYDDFMTQLQKRKQHAAAGGASFR